MAAKMTERQQLAIALRESMTGAPTSTTGRSVAAALTAASEKESCTPEKEEVSFSRCVCRTRTISPTHAPLDVLSAPPSPATRKSISFERTAPFGGRSKDRSRVSEHRPCGLLKGSTRRDTQPDFDIGANNQKKPKRLKQATFNRCGPVRKARACLVCATRLPPLPRADTRARSV